MRKLAVLLTLVMVFGLFCPVLAKGPNPPEEELQTEARQGFEQILDLWRDGKYGELYERTIKSGRDTKEHFIAVLDSAPLKPACCWEKMQDVQVTVKKANTVMLHAKVGLEGVVESGYKTRSFKLVKEDRVWKVSRSDILALASASKKRRQLRRK